ncbi:MAG: hypothetical protein FWH44_05715 [Methanomassiliicoccaceae archaeon]|nr:hypothetical protein [Methanomassiliicoccaceae archaeon]
MNGKLRAAVISATLLFLVLGFVLCINIMNRDPSNESGVMLIMLLLSSVMTLVVVVSACFIFFKEVPSERYGKIFLNERDDNDDDTDVQ